MPNPSAAAVLVALALVAPTYPAWAGTDSATHCIGYAQLGNKYALTNRCRFGIDLRFCSPTYPGARCGETLGSADLMAGQSFRIEVPPGDRLRYAACPAGDEVEVKWLNLRGRRATGFALECLSVGD